MAKKKHIYIVTGTTGRYSDWREWTVYAFKTEKAAHEYATLCEQEAARLEIKRESDFSSCGKSEFDPYIQMDFNGTKYHIEQVELRE